MGRSIVIKGLQVQDVDAGSSPMEVRLSVLHGTLVLADGSGVTVTGSGSDTLVLQLPPQPTGRDGLPLRLSVEALGRQTPAVAIDARHNLVI